MWLSVPLTYQILEKWVSLSKKYDMPYWTEASSLTHPSIQPPESASNAHYVLMNMINLCVGSL